MLNDKIAIMAELATELEDQAKDLLQKAAKMRKDLRKLLDNADQQAEQDQKSETLCSHPYFEEVHEDKNLIIKRCLTCGATKNC